MSAYSPDIEGYMTDKVASGEFPTRSDFVAEAVRLYREMELRHKQLQSDVQAAIEQSESEASLPLDMKSIQEELRQEIAENGQPH